MISTRWLNGSDDLSDAFAIRRAVFIDEQRVSPEEEYDGTDGGAIHLVCYDDGEPAATGRIWWLDGQCLLSRICVLARKRGQGLGDLVVRMLIRKAYQLGEAEQHIHAQTQAQGFYEKLGFTPYGGLYFEADIEHISMVHKGDVSGRCRPE